MRRRGVRAAADPIGRREWWAWGALVALAVAARFADLGSRPYQFDEGQVAYAAYGCRSSATTTTCRSCTGR